MRYIYVPVLSRNVWLSEDSERYLKELQSRAANDNVRRCVARNLRKWIINEAKLPNVVDIKTLATDDYPQWVKDKIDHEKIYYATKVTLEDEYHFSHIVDYLNTVPPRQVNVSNMSVPEAIKQTRDWDRKLQLQEDLVFEDGYKVVKKYDDGFSWVDVYGEKSLQREGALMKHCVGGYVEDVSNGVTKIYSLRDRQNMPHVTVEVDTRKNCIEQIKGKTNTVPTKYKEKIQDLLLSSKKFKIDAHNTDIKNLGFVILNGVLVDLDNYHGNLVDPSASLNIDGRKDTSRTRSYPKVDVRYLDIRNCQNLDIKQLTVHSVNFDDCKLVSNLVIHSDSMVHLEYCDCKKIKANAKYFECFNSDVTFMSSTIYSLSVSGNSSLITVGDKCKIQKLQVYTGTSLAFGKSVYIGELSNGEVLAHNLRYLPDNLTIAKGLFVLDCRNLPILGQNIKIGTLGLDNYSALTEKGRKQIQESISYDELLKEG